MQTAVHLGAEDKCMGGEDDRSAAAGMRLGKDPWPAKDDRSAAAGMRLGKDPWAAKDDRRAAAGCGLARIHSRRRMIE